MKLFKGLIISAGLVMAAGAANAQAVSPYEAGRSAAVPGYGPRLLPSQEVYTVLRDSGFSPLGIPRRRGFVYTIAVVDRRGGDGRLMIDARDGRIVRFVPASRIGDNFEGALATIDGPPGPPPPTSGVSRDRSARYRRLPAAPQCRFQSRARAKPAPAAAAAGSAAGARAARPAVGRGASQTGRTAHRRPVRCGRRRRRPLPRPRRGQAGAADPADPGHAERAGTGIDVAALLAMTWIKNAPVFRGVFVQASADHFFRPAAARIRSAISLGCDTSERCPASSSTVVAFMRFARNRSRSGLMV